MENQSSENYIQGCTGKKAYDKKGAITACNLRYKEDHTRLRIYPCGDHWHLTKQLRGNHIDYKRNDKKKSYTFNKQ